MHLDQLREHGGMPGVRDENGLEAALARPHQKWTCAKNVDLPDLAAAYAFGFATAHPFHDGNKRMAFLTMSIFLGLTKREIDASEADVVQATVALAAGLFTETQLAAWIRGRLVRLNI